MLNDKVVLIEAAAAVSLGTCIIEKHFILDRTMEGPDHAASLEFTGLQKLIRDIGRILQRALLLQLI